MTEKSSTDPMELLKNDKALEAKLKVSRLPWDDPTRQRVEELTAHTNSSEAYQEYYRTMRGGICPEDQVFRRHEQVKRFARIRELILERKHKTVLDLGCLDGWQLLNLAASGIVGVGIDLSPQALAVAVERSAKWGFGLRFIESSIEDAEVTENDLDGSGIPLGTKHLRLFDAVILSEVLEHVLDPVACMKTAARHLAPGGIVYVSVPATPIPHHGKLEDAREHLRVYSEQDLIDLATKAGLHVVVDQDMTEEQDQGQSFSNRMMSFRRATITIYTGHVTGGWNPPIPESLGGSEELVVKVAEAWARRGHQVAVYADVLSGTVNGVQYHSRSRIPDPNPDVLVCFKTLEYIDYPAGRTVFWTTDLPAPGQSATFLPPKLMDDIDAVICISEYHRQELLKAVPWLSPAKIHQHWLGVNHAEIEQACQTHQKAPHRVLYASSYDRGLRQLLEVWPTVRAAVPDAELHVTYGWDFWIKSEAVVAKPVADSMRQERKELEKLLAQSGVVHCGRLPRQDVLQEFAEAEIWAYPCTGGELCCKTALEVQVAGCEPVVVPVMALAETVQIGTKTTHAQFADALILALLEKSKVGGPFTAPSWDELSQWAWELAKPKQTASVQMESHPEVEPTVIPERFSIPSCATVPPVRELSILMAVSGMPFDGTTDRTKDLGGSETCAAQLSRALVKRGHSVTVFSNLPDKPGKFDGVTYLPIAEYARYAVSTPHDISIIQRDPTGFNLGLQSKMNILWCHDLGLKRYHTMFRSSMWNVDYVVPVSHWHGRQLCEIYDLPPDVVVPMNNGIDLEMIHKFIDRSNERDPNAVVFASRPERGLDVLLQSIFPRLLERNPKLTLYVAEYANTIESMVPFYQHCQQLMQNLGARAKWMGALKKPELYALYSISSAYLYPQRSFKEVSCLSLLEAAACGLPFVGTNLGALPETSQRVEGATRLVDHPGHEATAEFIDRYVDAAWEVLSNPELNFQMSVAGRIGAMHCSWDAIAEEWENFLLGGIELRSRDKLRLARHWWRLGDVNGVEYLLDELTPEERQTFRPIGDIKVARQTDAPIRPASHIINAICNVAAQYRPKTIRGLGLDGVWLADQVAGVIGAEVVNDAMVDFVVGFETLERAKNPVEYIASVERSVNPGGYICFISAISGVQQDRIHQGLPRDIRWVFDNHDLKELLGNKPDLLAMIVEGGALSKYDGRPLAWQLNCYQNKKEVPQSTFNLERRSWLQSPQLSLTGAMIVKNGESLLTRCLKSIVPYCDEVIVDDTGSTDTTPDILRRFGIEPGQGLNPIDVGFDAARNRGLKRATGDIVLWIDADEELLDAHNLPKYLRWSMYNGVAIQQHHFSAVPMNAFKPDLPVRIFRRIWLNGKPTGIRWYGFVHEHPELAINHSVGQSIVLSDVHIAHDGYLTETGRRGRFDRNIALMFRDRAAYPDRVLGKFLMIRDWIHLARYEAEQNRGMLTPSGVQYLEAALESYRKNFLGATHQMAVDGLPYYNEALQLLRRGFEVQVVLKVGGIDGQPREVTYSGRVTDKKDLETLVTSGIHDLTSVWDGEYL